MDGWMDRVTVYGAPEMAQGAHTSSNGINGRRPKADTASTSCTVSLMDGWMELVTVCRASEMAQEAHTSTNGMSCLEEGPVSVGLSRF